MADESIYDEMRKNGVSRRDFLKFSGMVAGVIGLNGLSPMETIGKVEGQRCRKPGAQPQTIRPGYPGAGSQVQASCHLA